MHILPVKFRYKDVWAHGSRKNDPPKTTAKQGEQVVCKVFPLETTRNQFSYCERVFFFENQLKVIALIVNILKHE